KVVLVVAAGDLAVAVSMVVVLLTADTSRLESAIAGAASASAGCVSPGVFRVFEAQGPAFSHSGLPSPWHARPTIRQPHVPSSHGSRISASRTCAITSRRSMTRTGTTTGTDVMLTFIIIASLSLSTGFGTD